MPFASIEATNGGERQTTVTQYSPPSSLTSNRYPLLHDGPARPRASDTLHKRSHVDLPRAKHAEASYWEDTGLGSSALPGLELSNARTQEG